LRSGRLDGSELRSLKIGTLGIVTCLVRCLQIAETATLRSRLARRQDGSKVTLVQAQKAVVTGAVTALNDYL
jgi:hypothetical protein